MDKQAAVAATMDVIDPVIDTIEAVPEVVRNNPVVLAGVAVVSASIGATVAVYLTRRILKTKYERLIGEELQEAKAFYQKRFKEGDYADPTLLAEQISDDNVAEEYAAETEMVKEAVDILGKQKYVSYDKVETVGDPSAVVAHSDVTIQQTNVFVTHAGDEEFDLDTEEAKKQQGKPYIITQEQFLENEDEYTQTTLTWYEGDNTLVDDRDQAVRNFVPIIGEDNLSFGYGSRDANSVYIRNDRFKADYEVVLSDASYAQHLGFAEPKPRRNGKSTRRFPREE